MYADDGWDWQLAGTAQPFEDLDRYRARRIRDRFDLDLLNAYCAGLGIRRDDPSFYGPRVLLIERDISDWPKRDRPTMSSAEWLKQYR